MTIGQFRKETANFPDELELTVRDGVFYYPVDARFRTGIKSVNKTLLMDLPEFPGERTQLLELVIE